MSVSVSMPQLGESVTEGTVTRWLKKEGERVEVDEPLLEVSTDKVDTEIPSPASGILRGIAVDEDETVAVGAQLAVIEDSEESGSQPGAAVSPPQDEAVSPPQDEAQHDAAGPAAAPEVAADSASAGTASADGQQAPGAASDGQGAPTGYAPPAADQAPAYAPPPAADQAPAYAPPPAAGQAPGYAPPPAYGYPRPAAPAPEGEAAPPVMPPSPVAPSAPLPTTVPAAPAASAPAAPAAPAADSGSAQQQTPLPGTGDAPYVTPLVRKLAAEHAVNLDAVTGTGVGGRIRKQDVVDAARVQREAQESQASAADAPPSPAAPAAADSQPAAPAAPARPAVVPSSLRGTTQRMSRPRQVIAQRMVESLRVSAQLTTVVEVDVTAIVRLRERAKRDFEAREGVKLSFLPFFAQAAMEALKVHPKLNAVIDGDQVTYHDTEHLGIAVDTERGLMVPVIHGAGDLNIGGLARKIGDLAERTRSGRVGPDELAGGTFTLTNTGSRGALFDTPIINQPQVAILGTGTVVKRPVVVEDPALGEVIAVRSMVYLALTYDHRLVDGADAARFLTTVKNRLEEGSFEAELGL
ncbi:MAG: 2-oxoglutarate dehydrogenase, E2 component, dihydrolipoamide succinyltransferase [Streptosporangiaceae bacterium]